MNQTAEIQSLIQKVSKNQLEICELNGKEKTTCEFSGCYKKAEVLMETFSLCTEHAYRLLDNMIPPSSQI
jgi:hypothetical protein